MTNECKKRLRIIKYDGSSKHAKIAERFLESTVKFEKIADLAAMFNCSVSSIHRFITKMGYPSFKHFQYDYQNQGSPAAVLTKETPDIKKHIEGVVSRVQGKLWFIPSRRGKAIAHLIDERFRDGKIDSECYKEENKNINEFVGRVGKGDTLVLLDITGHSYIISKALEEIAKRDADSRPNIIIITAAKWMKVFNKYPYIYIAKLLSSSFEDIPRWDDYNYILIRVIPTIVELLNAIGREKGII